MPHKHQICGNMVQNCLKPTTPSRSTEVQTHGWCHSVGNQVVEVIEIGNRNTGIIKNFRGKCQFMRQNMRYVHFAEMYEKCGNKRNKWHLHIRIKLACLSAVFKCRFCELCVDRQRRHVCRADVVCWSPSSFCADKTSDSRQILVWHCTKRWAPRRVRQRPTVLHRSLYHIVSWHLFLYDICMCLTLLLSLSWSQVLVNLVTSWLSIIAWG